jgi:hypothetical protein
MPGEEHHLALYQTHPLMRSGGFNVVFAALLIVSSLALFGGKLLVDISGSSSLDYIAGVGAAGERAESVKDERTMASESGEQAALPFSNQLSTSTGETEDSLIVRPVFESGPGKAYEYKLVPATSSSSTSISD